MRSLLDAPYRLALKASKRALGMNAKNYVRNATIVTLSHGVSILRGIVSGYLVARLFPRGLYGEYQFLQSVFGSLTFLSVPGIDKSLPRAIARGEKGALKRIFRWHVLACLSGSAVLLGCTALLPTFGHPELWPYFLLAAVLFPISQSASTLFGGIVSGEGRFGLSLKANITWSILMVIATLLIVFGLPSAGLLFIVSLALPAISYLWFSKGYMPKDDPSISTKPIIRYAWQMTIVSLPNYLSTYADKLLISVFLGMNQLAVFSVGILIPEQVKTWTKELLPVSLASQAKGEDTFKRRRALLIVVGRLTVLSILPVILYIVLAPAIFHLLLPNYPDAIFLSQIAACFLLLQPSALCIQYMEAQAMVKEIRWTQWLGAAIYVGSLVILLPIFGLVGAVIGRGMLRVGYALCSIFFLLKPPAQKP